MPSRTWLAGLTIGTSFASPRLQVSTPTQGGPPPSAGHALIYHERLGTVLLLNAGLGGMDDNLRTGRPTRVWAWDGHAWRVIDSAGPPVRNLAGVAYDSRRHAVVLHGGTASENDHFADTWEWIDGRWDRRDQPGPGRRDHTQMAYDAARGRAVLYGGQARTDSFPSDVWEWDGTKWDRIVVSGPGPGPKVHHAMTYDAARQRVVVFGGFAPGGSGNPGEAWEWDGRQWQRRLDTPAAPRTHAVAAYFDRAGGVVVVGGLTRQGPPPELLLLRDRTSGPLSAQGPPPRYLAGLATDTQRGLLVLFGGGDATADGLLADTWEFDGAVWVKR